MTKRTSMAVLFLVAFAGIAAASPGDGTSVTLKAGLLFPSDALFREIYSGGLSFGAEVAVPLAGVLRFWAGAELYGKTGLLTVSEEETKVRIIPLYAGLRAQFGKKNARPYIGVAAAYFLFHEENPLGTTSVGRLGLLTQAGVMARLGGALWLDLFAGYRACAVRSDGDEPLEAKLDSFSAGVGLAYRF
jgi:hypothetical protein